MLNISFSIMFNRIFFLMLNHTSRFEFSIYKWKTIRWKFIGILQINLTETDKKNVHLPQKIGCQCRCMSSVSVLSSVPSRRHQSDFLQVRSCSDQQVFLPDLHVPFHIVVMALTWKAESPWSSLRRCFQYLHLAQPTYKSLMERITSSISNFTFCFLTQLQYCPHSLLHISFCK